MLFDLHSVLDPTCTAPTVRFDDDVGILTTSTAFATFNGVITRGLRPRDDNVRDATAPFHGSGRPWSIQTRRAPGESLVKIAASLGLTRRTEVPLMVVNLEERALRTELGHHRVVDIDGVRASDFAAAMAAGFECSVESIVGLATREILDDPRVRAYAVENDDELTSTAVAITMGRCVAFFAVATSPAARRGGQARALMQIAMLDASRAGATVGVLQASPSGQPMYEALGFHTRETWTYLATARARPAW